MIPPKYNDRANARVVLSRRRLNETFLFSNKSKSSELYCAQHRSIVRGYRSKSIVWDLHRHPIEIFLHCDLATQTGRIGHLKGQIQHIVLLVFFFR